jgi:heme/copper-type cytochrome/quinol oxidase subunit 2
MVVEARKLRVSFVWLYVILGFAIAISVTFPLFLIARERRLAKADTTPSAVKLTATDILGLAVTTVVVLAMCGFILF